jgi:hypothetical protein
MKKISYIILSVILIALLIFFYQKTLKDKLKSVKHDKDIAKVEGVTGEAETPIEEIRVKEIVKSIPADGVLYINFRDLKSVYESIDETNFFVKFTGLKIFEKLREDIKKFNSESTFDLSFDNILKILGNDLFISFYYEHEIQPEILISTALDGSVSYVAKIAAFFMQKKADEDEIFEYGTETYGGIDISYITDKEKKESFYYLIIEELAHFSSSLDLMKNVVDIEIEANNLNNLSASPKYMEAAKNFRDNNFFNFFFDFQSLSSIQEILVNEYGAQNPNLNKTIPAIENYNYMYADAIVDKGVDLVANVYLKDDASSEHLTYLNELHGTPKKSGFSKIVKEAPLFFASYNEISIAEYYDYIKKTFQDTPNMFDSFEEGFKNLTGMYLTDDIIPLLDDEVVYMGTGVNVESSFIPFPDMFIGVRLKDADRFAIVYEKVNESLAKPDNNLRLKEDEYNGYKYKYALTPFGILPGHGIVSDYYVIFSSPSSFTKIVDELNSDTESYFEREEQKSTMDEFLYSDYHYYSYLDSSLIVQLIPDLFDKYSMLIQGSMTNEERRDFLKTYNDEILPFLETLKAFEHFTWSGYYDEDKSQFSFKSHYLMKDI